MNGFNYPNHPLFRIAPLLDKGFQTVGFDPYERVLVAKIRAGRYTADLWDCNSLYVNYPNRLDALLDAPANRQRTAIKSRYEMTAEQRTRYRAWCAAQAQEHRAQRAQRAQQSEAEEAERVEERARVQREWAALQARRAKERERRDREWADRAAELKAEGEQRLKERAAILAGSWECASCLRPSIVMPLHGKYRLTCPRCAKTAIAEHAALLALVNARNAQHQPANPT